MQKHENINVEDADKYILSIRITLATFVFCIYEADTKKIIAFDEIHLLVENNISDEIQRIIFESEFLTYPYRDTRVIFASKDYSLVPEVFLENEKKDVLYNFTHVEPASRALASPDIVQGVATIFNVDQGVYKFLSRNLSNPQFYHHTNIMMQYIEKLNAVADRGFKMYLNFYDGYIDVYCYNPDGRVLSVLTYEDEYEKNIIYYILNIWDKNNFDQNETPLYIFKGYGIPNLYITNKLREYIRNVEDISLDERLDLIKGSDLNIPLALDFLILNGK